MQKILEKLQVLWSKTNRFHRVLLIFLLAELKVIPGRQLGFHCKDPALSHPYTGDTISWKWLMAVTIFLPFVVMLLIELKYHNEDKQRPRKRALRWYREYMYGFLLNLTLVQLLKLLVGSPRPHFFDTCMPLEADDCQGSEYVSTYTCSKAHWINQSDRSFPSGHTSLAVHAGLFIVYYLHKRTPSPHARSIQAVQVALTAAAVYCALSRMSDHRHHWWDVLAGAVIALAALFYTIHFLCKDFACHNSKLQAVSKQETSTDVQTKETNGVPPADTVTT